MQLLVARHGELVHHSVLGHASLEKGELTGMETVLRQEPNALAIVSADIVAKMEISKQIAALPIA